MISYLSYKSPFRPRGHELGAKPAQDLIGYTHMRSSLTGPSCCASLARPGPEAAAAPVPELAAAESAPSSEEVPKLAALAWLWHAWSRPASVRIRLWIPVAQRHAWLQARECVGSLSRAALCLGAGCSALVLRWRNAIHEACCCAVTHHSIRLLVG